MKVGPALDGMEQIGIQMNIGIIRDLETPVLTDCVITSGIDAGIVITEQVSGKKVVCGDGSGNCVNGSSCTVK